MSIRIGIMGYGNLGRGVECAVKHNPDLELAAVFTRRDPETVKILTETAKVCHVDEAEKMKDEIDVLIICGGSATLLQSNCATQCIRPAGVLKRNGLYTLDNFIHIDSFAQAKVARIFEAGKAILGKALFDFGHSSFFTFKLDIVSHVSCPPLFCFLQRSPSWDTPDLESSVCSLPNYSSRGSMYFAAPSKRPYWPIFCS